MDVIMILYDHNGGKYGLQQCIFASRKQEYDFH